MILLYHVIICFIFIDIKQITDKNQTKSDLLQNKINTLENRIDKISAKLNEYNLINNHINNNKYISEVELSEISFEKFDENVLQQIKNQQMEFCNNENKYRKGIYEEQIRLTNIDILNKSYHMYIYKREDYVSNNILREKSWEGKQSKALIDALNYYSSLKKIKNSNIFILDIGANIGWYSIFLGKYGYRVLSFEPSDINIYILRKNYCLNPNLNIIFIKKGLYNEEKKCDHYILRGNVGNGMIICDNNVTVPYGLIKSSEIIITKLSNYIEFLSKRNLALIKIDIEGSEGKAIESGIELITNYHVPFIFLDFTPKSLRLHGTDPMKFLEMFENNGYKFPKDSFFDNKYYTKQELMVDGLFDLFIVYSNIIK